MKRRVVRKHCRHGLGDDVGKLICRDPVPDVEEERPPGLARARFAIALHLVWEEQYPELYTTARMLHPRTARRARPPAARHPPIIRQCAAAWSSMGRLRSVARMRAPAKHDREARGSARLCRRRSSRTSCGWTGGYPRREVARMLPEDERNQEAVVDFGIDPANTLSVAGNVHLREHRRVTRIDRRRISPIRRRSIAALHCSAFNYGQLNGQIHGQFDLNTVRSIVMRSPSDEGCKQPDRNFVSYCVRTAARGEMSGLVRRRLQPEHRAQAAASQARCGSEEGEHAIAPCGCGPCWRPVLPMLAAGADVRDNNGAMMNSAHRQPPRSHGCRCCSCMDTLRTTRRPGGTGTP